MVVRAANGNNWLDSVRCQKRRRLSAPFRWSVLSPSRSWPKKEYISSAFYRWLQLWDTLLCAFLLSGSLVRADWLIVCQIWFIPTCKSQVGVSLVTFMLRDEMSVAWNWPWLGWECWHHGNRQVLKNHLFHFSPEMLLACWPLVRTSSSSPLNL